MFDIIYTLLKKLLCLKPLAALAALACAVILSLTGFGPGLTGGHLHGYPLMLHVSCAPVFLLAMAFLAVTWAGANDLSVAISLRAICFWIILILALPLTLSIVLSMLPIFGSHGQEVMYGLHRTVAWPFAGATLLFSVLAWTSRKKK